MTDVTTIEEQLRAIDDPTVASKIASEATWGEDTRQQQRLKYHRLMAGWYEAKSEGTE